MKNDIAKDIKENCTKVLSILLKDKTTKKNIIWATDDYNQWGYSKTDEITEKSVLSRNIISTRSSKGLEEKLSRQKGKAEVFTPSWICNKMNNHCDTEWFERENVFNTEDGQSWIINPDDITFPEMTTWQDYVESKRIEITCGEAPYVVSRYDATTGEMIPIRRRIGILDRKLRVINENAETEEEWIKWTIKALQSVYGYEFQGDNLLIARINILMTFIEYYKDRLGKSPESDLLRKVANIIVWNFWQMDGLTDTIPYGQPEEDELQTSFFDMVMMPEEKEETTPVCRIYDWKANHSILFTDVKRS